MNSNQPITEIPNIQDDLIKSYPISNHNLIENENSIQNSCDETEQTESDFEEFGPKNNSNYKCNFCEKLFKTRQKKYTHHKTHKAKLQCEYCNRMLANKRNLADHILIHKGEKPYKCISVG